MLHVVRNATRVFCISLWRKRERGTHGGPGKLAAHMERVSPIPRAERLG